jgi:mitochondrial chaperone BCS1
MKVLKELCECSLSYSISKDKGCTNIYAISGWLNIWEKVQSKKQRPISSVILDSNIAEEVINDIINFQKNAQWYIDRGVPYRRGYLLYGPPGSGKTSFVMAIAAELKMSICTLNLSGLLYNSSLYFFFNLP